MENNYIELKRERDFGEVFNAAFAFIRQEFKKLFKALFIYSFPFLILAVIGITYFNYQNLQIISTGNPGSMAQSQLILQNFISMVPTIIFSMLGISMMYCTVYAYIKLYADKGKEGFEIKDLFPVIKKFFLPFIGTSIVAGIVYVIGFMLCILPGIFFAVSLSVIFIALIIEEKGFSSAFNRSFQLVKQTWWTTFLILLLAYIIVYLMSLLLSVPMIIFSFKNVISLQQNTAQVTSMMSLPYTIYSAVVNLITYVFNLIPTIIIAFHYFNLVEKLEKPSLQDKIDQIV